MAITRHHRTQELLPILVQKLERQLWIYSGSWTRDLPLILPSSLTLSLSVFLFLWFWPCFETRFATMSPSRRRTERAPFMAGQWQLPVLPQILPVAGSVVKLARELLLCGISDSVYGDFGLCSKRILKK